jgi:hypothetical protein
MAVTGTRARARGARIPPRATRYGDSAPRPTLDLGAVGSAARGNWHPHRSRVPIAFRLEHLAVARHALERWYRRLTRMYPAPFRDEYEQEMVTLVRDRRDEATGLRALGALSSSSMS